MLYNLKGISSYTSLYCGDTVYYIPNWLGCCYTVELMCNFRRVEKNRRGNKERILKNPQILIVTASINVFMIEVWKNRFYQTYPTFICFVLSCWFFLSVNLVLVKSTQITGQVSEDLCLATGVINVIWRAAIQASPSCSALASSVLNLQMVYAWGEKGTHRTRSSVDESCYRSVWLLC